MDEEWAIIEEANDYEISNLGEIRRARGIGGTRQGSKPSVNVDENGEPIASLWYYGTVYTRKQRIVKPVVYFMEKAFRDSRNQTHGI